MERWKNRFTLDNPRLIQRYLKGELDIVVVLVASFFSGGLRDTEDFCAVFQRELKSLGVSATDNSPAGTSPIAGDGRMTFR
jgi:hypothetical protein